MPRPRMRTTSASLAAALLLSGCAAAADSPRPRAAAPAAAATPTASPEPSCTPAPLAERAAAVLVVGMPHVVSPAEPLARTVADLGVGGVFLSEPNVETAEQVAALTAGLRRRAGRPLLVSTDEESGRVAVARKIVGAGPSPRRLARERTPAQVRTFARDLGRRLSALGVDLDLAPSLDLDDGPSGGIIGDRSFSADPARATAYGLAFSAGLLDAGVTPTVKHFPGQGRSAKDTHKGGDLVQATVEDLRDTDLAPFQAAIDAGAPVIMLNHLRYTGLDASLPASLSPKAYALLREMGFVGVAMTDSIGMGAVHKRWDFPEATVRAVSAGADAVLATDGRQAVRMRDALVAAVRSGRLPEDRLSEAAARMTALAGGDPQALSCLPLQTPTLRVPAGGAASSTPSPAS